MEKIKIDIPKDKIAAFCRRWKVRELSLFGSAIREDAPWSVFDLIEMTGELKTFFGREVDLVEKEALRNPFRRHSILTNREVIYTA